MTLPGGCGPSDGEASIDSPKNGDPRQLAAVQPGSEWCLGLQLSRPEVLLGEPVAIVVRLTNCSDRSTEIRDLLSPEYGLLSVFVTRPGAEEEVLYFPAVRRDGRGRLPIELQPGEALFTQVPIYFAREGWFLQDVGTYSIRAEYPIDEISARSEAVRLRVVEPETASERRAASEFMAPEASRFFFLQGGDAEGASALRRVADAYAGTPWATYSRMALVLDEHASATGTERTFTCQRVVDALGASLPAIGDPVVASEGYSTLVECLGATGRSDDADRLFSRYQEQYSGIVGFDPPDPRDPDPGDPGRGTASRSALERDVAMASRAAPQETRRFAVEALSRGTGVPTAAREALRQAREILERDLRQGVVVDIQQIRIGLEGDTRLCAEYESAEAAASARREIARIVQDVDLVNLVSDSCR